ADLYTNRFIHGDNDLASQLVIPTVLVIEIDAQTVKRGCKSIVPLADFAIPARIPHRPRKLLTHHFNEYRLLLGFFGNVGDRPPREETEEHKYRQRHRRNNRPDLLQRIVVGIEISLPAWPGTVDVGK